MVQEKFNHIQFQGNFQENCTNFLNILVSV